MSYRTEVQWNPQRIAVFRAMQLGDLLQAVPALRALRAGFPDAEITLIGLPWAKPFVQRFHHYVDRFVEFVGYPGIAEVEVVPERTSCFIEQQQAYSYDLVFQMHGSGRRSNRFVLALGSRMTVAYYDDQRPEGLTLGAPYPSDEPEVLRNLGLAKLLGCPNCDPRLEFPLCNKDRAEAATLLYDRAKLLDVGGFSWWHRLPPQHAGEEVVVQFLLIRKYGGCGILPSGTYHLGLPTTVEDRRRNATELFGELMLEYDVHPVGPVEPLEDRETPRFIAGLHRRST